MQFATQSITTPVQLQCPACKEVVFIAKSDGAEVPGRRYWLDDGDSVGALFEHLTEEQKTPTAWFPTLMVGRCPACSSRYYVFFAALMDAVFDDVVDYLLSNTDLGPDRYVTCQLTADTTDAPTTWLLKENHTDAGVMHEHTFGPFALEDTAGVIGPNGVSSCNGRAAPWTHAARVLASLWDDMRAFNRERGQAHPPLKA
ncbi:hypothetical protein RKE25_23240 (plasmid) [Dyella sp. BiH032]|uniref:hypothetical protein n=1 Tax=Dyella sp. BiH032 TaxID=3075430 RepID=UPI0028933F8C|nr:hypothetical protein [Dyella sp. BiH032]WNL48531.1 hypothetical protein RKE25_23240 [Dyella sp. BiH032]